MTALDVATPAMSSAPARAAALLLLNLSARRRRRILAALPPEQQTDIQAALHQAQQLHLTLEDVQRAGAHGLALFDCKSRDEVCWLQACQQPNQLTAALQQAFLQAVRSAQEAA